MILQVLLLRPTFLITFRTGAIYVLQVYEFGGFLH